MADEQPLSLIELSSEIVAAYVANNSVSGSELPGLIAAVHGSLSGLGQAAPEAPSAKPTRPTGVRASIKPDHLISMIDGKAYKMLRRHLTTHGLTPEQYRERFDLPEDYPMVASAFAATRSALSKAIGLGRKAGTKVVDAAASAEHALEDAIKPTRGRKKEAAKPLSGKDALEKARSGR